MSYIAKTLTTGIEMKLVSVANQTDIHLQDAEAYFLLAKDKNHVLPYCISDGAYERKMWIELFKWAGWSDVSREQKGEKS